jgi:hypothetical protein
MHEVAAAGPLLDLHAGQVGDQVLPFRGRQDATEHRQVGHAAGAQQVLDSGLGVVRVGVQHLVPVAEHDVGADDLGRQDPGAQRLGHQVESQALLHRLERRREARAPEARLETSQQLRERPDVHGLVDVDHAEHRIGRP